MNWFSNLKIANKLISSFLALGAIAAAVGYFGALHTHNPLILLAIFGAGFLLVVALGLLMARMISRPVHNLAAAVDKLAAGEVDVAITADTKDEIGMLADSFATLLKLIKGLLSETEKLTRAAQDGKLDFRGNTADYQGAWSDLLNGVNKLIDAFVGPINVTAEYVDRKIGRASCRERV